MKNSSLKRFLTALLAVVMVVGILPASVFAALPVADEMTLISDKESTLAPGITQNESIILDKNGNRVELFVAVADLNVDTVGVQSSYVGAQCVNHGMAKMTEQVAAAEKKYEERGEQYTAVVAMNGSYYNMTTGQPAGAFYMEGVNGNGSNPNGNPFFAILKDGTPVIGKAGQYNTYADQIWECVGGNEILVWEGKNTYASTDTAKYPRSAVGITADNKVIFINANGNQAPKSVGLTRYELGQLFVELGCVSAIKYDEGGSATYCTKPQGSDTIQVTNTPSDGAERPVSTGLIIYSTAKGDGEFDSAVLTAENEYVTPESSVKVSAIGSDAVGGAAEIPADITWQLADSSMGTVENGVFTSNGTVGEAVIQMVYNGEVVGQTTVHVVIPEIAFDNAITVVPYGKTMALTVNATVNDGANTVVLKDGDVVYSLSDAALGTISGSNFTACAESSGLTGGTLTATFKYDSTKTTSTEIQFGKGSEIVQDFENAVDSDFTVRSLYVDRNDPNNTKAVGPMGRMERGEAWVVDSTTGKVRNGEKALAVNADFGVSTAAGAKSVVLHFPALDVTGATSIGMWIYVGVKEMSNLELTFRTNSTITTPSYTTVKSVALFKWKDFNGGSVQPTEDGWYYFQVDVSDFNQIAALNIQITDPDNTVWNPYQNYTFYIDDITADFSSAVEDRENPTFSGAYISETADSKVAMNGQTITTDTVTVVANAAENTAKVNATGLNISSAKVYLDGEEITSGVTCAADGTIMADSVKLSNGVHTFRFEIADKAGNVGTITRQVVVNKTNGKVTLVPANPDAALVPLGSVLYYNLVAENIENVQSVTTSIELDNVSSWDLEGIEVPYGFEATYTVDDLNIAHITITRTGDVEVSGEAVLAKLPVRVWAPVGHTEQAYIDAGVVSANPGQVDSYKMMTPYGMWYSDGTRMYRVEVEVLAGKVNFVDGTSDTFSTEEHHTLTEMNRYRADGHYDANWNYIVEDSSTSVKEVRQDKWSSHIHVAGAAQDKAATCTTPGYTGRIFCVGCDCGSMENIYQATADVDCKGHEGGCASVIDWGTVIPATGHTYEVIDGVLKCACGKTFTGVYTDGKEYVDGIMVGDGWNAEGTKYYVDGVALTGTHIMDNVVYVFGEDGTYDETASTTYLGFVEYNGKLYYAQLGKLVSGWQSALNTVVDDNPDDYVFVDEYVYYYFMPDTYEAFEEGTLTMDGKTYEFADKILIAGHWNGIYLDWAGDKVANGWKTIKGETYFFWYGYAYTGIREVHLTYNSVETDWHMFDEKGVHIKIMDGLHEDYYYIDGYRVPAYYGLIEVDGYYYYVNDNAKIIKDAEKYVNRPNGLTFPDGTAIPRDYFYFDAEGKMVYETEDSEPETPEEEVLNGIVGDYYYIDGERAPAYYGLVLFEGDYYYVNAGGKIVKDAEKYVNRPNGLTFPDGTAIEKAYFYFDAEGKMVIE